MKINQELSISFEDESNTLKLAAMFKTATLRRVEAVKLRNYLNKYINGELDEDDDEPSIDVEAEFAKAQELLAKLKGKK